MLRFAGLKLLMFAAVVLLASLAIFAAIRAVPGDPVALRLKNPDPVRVAAERERLGLDRPWLLQYGRYLAQFATGDWGRSLTVGRPVRTDVAEFLPATLELGLAALLLGTAFGVATALLAEALHVRWLARVAAGLGTLGLTVPIFWIGMLAIVVGSLWLGWFPASGRYDLAAAAPARVTGFLTLDALWAGRPDQLAVALRHLALPTLCLALYPAAQVCAVLQARLRDPQVQALVLALRARGFGPARVWLRHVLRLASAPVLAVTGTTAGTLLGGAVLTETVFSWPGLGRYLVAAVLDRDLYVVQNVLLLVILGILAVVTLAELAAHWLNPQGMRGGGDD
jgi:ABC-type dipeptide/oligopeptide/nickel transport system permease component